MKYGFVRLNCIDEVRFMEVGSYEKYKHCLYSSLSPCVPDALVVVDGVYIACFPTVFHLDQLLRFNDEASIVDELPLNDIAFDRQSVSAVARLLGCENC